MKAGSIESASFFLLGSVNLLHANLTILLSEFLESEGSLANASLCSLVLNLVDVSGDSSELLLDLGNNLFHNKIGLVSYKKIDVQTIFPWLSYCIFSIFQKKMKKTVENTPFLSRLERFFHFTGAKPGSVVEIKAQMGTILHLNG